MSGQGNAEQHARLKNRVLINNVLKEGANRPRSPTLTSEIRRISLYREVPADERDPTPEEVLDELHDDGIIRFKATDGCNDNQRQ